jgi:hypothetical protein
VIGDRDTWTRHRYFDLLAERFPRTTLGPDEDPTCPMIEAIRWRRILDPYSGGVVSRESHGE